MVYQSKTVVCIKTGGKVLREFSGTVTLPFGSEYSVFCKNLNSVRIMVKVFVDGQDATDGTRLIIQPNSSLELERFIRNGNLASGNRFKFIERSAEVEQHRGIQADDGLVRVEYWTEKVVREETVIRKQRIIEEYDYWPWYPPRPWPRPYPRPYEPWVPKCWEDVLCKSETGQIIGTSSNAQARFAGNLNANAPSMDSAFNDAGITVPGSVSGQQFYHASSFPVGEHSDVIVLKLRGEVAGQVVQQPITVNHKPKCNTCGRTNKGGSQFCSQCGTALVIV